MPILPPIDSPISAPEVAPFLEELRYLRRGVLEGRGRFCLYPVESNLRGDDRTTAFRNLRHFLEDAGMHLRVDCIPFPRHSFKQAW